MLPILSLDGRRGRRRAALRARRAGAGSRYIYDFGLRYARALPEGSRELFQDAVNAVWEGDNEVDGFNALVLAAGLTWRQATVLRAYAKYMRQGGTPFAQDYIEDALATTSTSPAGWWQLFEARFDPGRNGDIAADGEARQAKTAEIEERINRALDDVASLDHDRILRSYLTVIRATLRTNYFQPDADGGCTVLHVPQARARTRSRTCPSRGRSSRSSSTRRGSRACTCASAPSPVAACAGRTGATTSAPRCWAWSRRRW